MDQLLKFAAQVDADIERRREILKKGETGPLTIGEYNLLTPEQQEGLPYYKMVAARNRETVKSMRKPKTVWYLDNKGMNAPDYLDGERRGFNDGKDSDSMGRAIGGMDSTEAGE